MKPADIAKIRQRLKTVRSMVECPHAEHVDECDFCKRTRLLDEALALLLCETCGGTGKEPEAKSWPDGLTIGRGGKPCSDC